MNSWQKIIISKSKVFFFCLVIFILGVGISSFIQIDTFILFCFILLSALGLVFFYYNKNWRIIFLWILFLFLGLWRYQIALPSFNDSSKIYYYNNQSVRFYGAIINLDERIGKQKITIAAQEITINRQQLTVGGKVLITTALYPKFNYGDEVAVECFLKKPEPFAEFAYDKYLARYDIYSVCSFVKVSKIELPRRQLAHLLLIKGEKKLLKIKDKLSDALSQTIIEPQAAFFQSLILNERGNLSQEWLDKFSQTGLTHIIAISGSHIAIIVMILMSLATGLGMVRQKAFWLTAVVIILYVFIIGSPASAGRSAIMGLLVLYAQKIGRLSQATNSIIFAAALMLLINPKILIFDVGFQLSFAAVFGLIYLMPIFKNYFSRLPNFWQFKEIFIMTLSAQIMTLPLIIFYFHRLSLVSLLANILTLPIVPFLMLWGFFNGLVGAFFLPLGKIFGYISYFSGGYFLLVADQLAKLPLASVEIPALNVSMVIFLYALIGFWVYNKNVKCKSQNVKYKL